MKKTAGIRGYTAEEVAESRRIELEKDYKKCCEKQEDIKLRQRIIETAKLELEECKHEHEKMLSEYRRDSVDRVLSYIRTKKITDAHELDLLLCHCKNKLNGNIDGTELNLHYEERSNGSPTEKLDAYEDAEEHGQYGKWIPVSERLPEESLNSVIGWDTYRNRCCFVQYLGGRFVLGDDIYSVNVTAWMPLPEPYRESEEEQ